MKRLIFISFSILSAHSINPDYICTHKKCANYGNSVRDDHAHKFKCEDFNCRSYGNIVKDNHQHTRYKNGILIEYANRCTDSTCGNYRSQVKIDHFHKHFRCERFFCKYFELYVVDDHVHVDDKCSDWKCGSYKHRVNIKIHEHVYKCENEKCANYNSYVKTGHRCKEQKCPDNKCENYQTFVIDGHQHSYPKLPPKNNVTKYNSYLRTYGWSLYESGGYLWWRGASSSIDCNPDLFRHPIDKIISKVRVGHCAASQSKETYLITYKE